MVDENAPHHLCANRVRVTAVLSCDAVLTGESQKHLVHEWGGLHGAIRSFVPQVNEQLTDQRLRRNRSVAIQPGVSDTQFRAASP